jgi:subtilase family serine protease
VVIVGDNPDAESDLATYRAGYGLSPCTTANGCFKKVNRFGEQGNYPPPAGGNWAVEGASDIELVSAICPNCHIILVEAPGPEEDSTLATAENTAVALGANEITNSWEHALKAEDLGYEEAFNHPGVLITVASGDFGYTSQVWPAASPHVMAVGGTSLFEAPNARGFEEFAWSLGGSTCAQSEPKPSWQTDTGCAYRTTSDISAVADWKNSPVSIYDVYEHNSFGEIGWESWGGTSASSPIIAATYALTNSYTRSFGPQAIWQYAKEGGSLNDIISGKNSVSGCEVTYLCWAGPGFDGPTGWGTPWGAPIVKPPPVVSTGAATGIQESSVTLNGTVNPNGLDAKYYFEYGETTSYGSSTASSDAGSGTSGVPVSVTLHELHPGTVYHYRLVATTSAGTSYGSGVEFTTLSEQHSNPTWAIRNASTGHQSVYYIGSEHAIWEWAYYAGVGWESYRVGGEAEAGTTPSATVYEGNQVRVYYTGTNHAIWELSWNGHEWGSRQLGGEVEAGTSPSATVYEYNQMRVYYTGKNHAIWEWAWNGSTWGSRQLGGEVGAGTSPSAMTYESNQVRVYYTGADHAIWQWGWSPEWALNRIGGEVEPGTSPSSTAYKSNQVRVYYTGKNHSVCEWGWLGSEWAPRCLGGEEVEAGASPSASAYLSEQMRVYYTDKKHSICEWGWHPEWASRCLGGVAPEAKTRLAVLFEPYAGNAWVYYRGSGGIVSWSWNGVEWANAVL